MSGGTTGSGLVGGAGAPGGPDGGSTGAAPRGGAGGPTASPPNGGTGPTGLRSPTGITKEEADVFYVNTDVTGDAMLGPLTVEGRLVALDPAAGNALTWTQDGLYSPPPTIPPEVVTEDELAAEGFLTAAAADALFLTPAEGDARYATVGHTHPSEESGPWRFQDNTTITNPGAGYLRTNTGNLATATILSFSRTTQDGYDIPPPGWGLAAGDTIYIQDRDDSTKWVRYNALEPLVRFPTYATGLVEVEASAGSIVNGQIVQVTFSLAGGGGGGGLDYAQLLVSTTPPPAPTAPTDAFWLHPTEEA